MLERHAGVARATELDRSGRHDGELDRALTEAGFDEILDPETQQGALEATLLIEAIARAAGVVPFAARALIAPAVAGRRLQGTVALGEGDRSHPVRYGAQAAWLLWATDDEALLAPLDARQVEPVASNFGYPLGRVPADAVGAERSLGPGSAARLRAWWRLAVAAEAVGTMASALDRTVSYLTDRKQFGVAIGSFQAVQHRLAECAVRVEASRWLVYEAAHHRAQDEATTCAAAYALESARQVFRETHQLSGAIGFTRDHPLHVWSMRLHALGSELEGARGHRRALARARWGVA